MNVESIVDMINAGHIFELFFSMLYFRNPNHSYKMRSERFVERNSMDSFPDSGLRSNQTSTKEVQRKDSRPTATPMYDIGTEIRPTPRWILISTVICFHPLCWANVYKKKNPVDVITIFCIIQSVLKDLFLLFLYIYLYKIWDILM